MSRAFASLSSTLLARKGGARPAMRSPLQGQGDANSHDPLNDCGWNDMGTDPAKDTSATLPVPKPVAKTPSVVAFEPVASAEPLLARKPAVAEVVQFVRDTPARPAATLAAVGGQPILRRARTAAFTLRLEPDRHFRLRVACAQQSRSAQALVTDALDRFLDCLPEIESLAAQGGTQRIA